MLPDPIGAYSRTSPGSAPATRFNLKGILISPSERIALINDKMTREGDHLGSAEILAIDEGAVRILVGSQEFTLHVGSTTVRARSSRPSTRTTLQLIQAQSIPGQPVGSVSSEALTLAPSDTHARHGPVKQGETLSGIAQHYRSDGVTINQIMIALFQANPESFGGNINVLREGAILRIPDERELRRQTPETATVEVMRQTDAWRIDYQQPSKLAKVPDQEKYGPVLRGETLSGIAQRFMQDDVTISQLMIGLFEANPKSFGGNINILYAGTVLRIPDGDELRRQPPEAAMAEVLRQTDAWRSRLDRQRHART